MAEQYTSHLQLREAHAELQLSEDVFEAGGAQKLRIAQDVPPHSIPLNVIIGQVERRQGPQRSQTRIGLRKSHTSVSAAQNRHNTRITHSRTHRHRHTHQSRNVVVREVHNRQQGAGNDEPADSSQHSRFQVQFRHCVKCNNKSQTVSQAAVQLLLRAGQHTPTPVVPISSNVKSSRASSASDSFVVGDLHFFTASIRSPTTTCTNGMRVRRSKFRITRNAHTATPLRSFNGKFRIRTTGTYGAHCSLTLKTQQIAAHEP
jgi:hypothetical protein